MCTFPCVRDMYEYLLESQRRIVIELTQVSLWMCPLIEEHFFFEIVFNKSMTFHLIRMRQRMTQV